MEIPKPVGATSPGGQPGVEPGAARGGSGTSADSTVRESYSARGLQVSDIPGRVRVRVGQGPDMDVRISGSESLVKRIQREVRDGVLCISGPRGGGGGMTVVSSGGRVQSTVIGGSGFVVSGGSMHIGGGFISAGPGDVIIAGGRVISGGSKVTVVESEEVQVVVDVPLRTPIRVDEGTIGQYDIGDTEGALDLRLRGSGDVTVGSVGATRLDLGGASEADIQKVSGREFRASISGSGNVTVRDGEVDTLEVRVAGTGDVTFGGVARRADLSVSGVGNIRVNEVTESYDDRVSGIGRIYVHVPPPRSRDTFFG